MHSRLILLLIFWINRLHQSWILKSLWAWSISYCTILSLWVHSQRLLLVAYFLLKAKYLTLEHFDLRLHGIKTVVPFMFFVVRFLLAHLSSRFLWRKPYWRVVLIMRSRGLGFDCPASISIHTVAIRWELPSINLLSLIISLLVIVQLVLLNSRTHCLNTGTTHLLWFLHHIFAARILIVRNLRLCLLSIIWAQWQVLINWDSL